MWVSSSQAVSNVWIAVFLLRDFAVWPFGLFWGRRGSFISACFVRGAAAEPSRGEGENGGEGVAEVMWHVIR